jgi:hypothetical protein
MRANSPSRTWATVGGPSCGCGFVPRPADGDAPVARLTPPAGLVELSDQASVSLRGDQAVAQTSRELGAPWPSDSNEKGRQFLGHRVEAGVFDRVVAPVVTYVLALPQEPNHRDGLFQASVPDLGLGPALSHDVLVEGFPGAHAEEEASGHHGGDRR